MRSKHVQSKKKGHGQKPKKTPKHHARPGMKPPEARDPAFQFYHAVSFVRIAKTWALTSPGCSKEVVHETRETSIIWVVRSGIAAAPNYDEARSGESRADFVHKVNIALKELVETRGRLKFIILARLLPARRIAVLGHECQQLCRIFGKSIATAKAAGHPDWERNPITNNKSSMNNS